MMNNSSWVENYRRSLYHHGIKNQKWGVRNGPPYPLSRKNNSAKRSGIVKQTITGHKPPPPKAVPNSIIEHKADNGSIKTRAFYDSSGWKNKEINTNDHGNAKEHPYGKHGEHVHEYEWNDDGSLKRRTTRDLNDQERKENGDII